MIDNSYNRTILFGNRSKPYNIQGTSIIKATTIGSNTVQQNDINWSNRILGKLALAQINTKIIILDLIPSIIPETIPEEKLPISGITIDFVSGKVVIIDCNVNSTSSLAE